jgi:hypothetical protein
MNDKAPIFTALEKIDMSAEDAAVAWCNAAAMLDYLSWETMEEALGARQAHIIYSRIWEKLAQAGLPVHLAALGWEKKTDFTMHDLGVLSKRFWNSISCTYEVVEETDDILVGEISDCPYWEHMRIIYGEDLARDMVKKSMGATTSNYYQAIVKALGKWDEIYATQDRCICLGDEKCRVVFKRRNPKFKDMTENI